ncbi:hypothetical protein [Chitinimonas taiwanensis]|uniref:hypothetical protein n=1 Tax=Chitinimonas taiwanensis TaxID=240412 RepID=UPI0035AE1D56
MLIAKLICPAGVGMRLASVIGWGLAISTVIFLYEVYSKLGGVAPYYYAMRFYLPLVVAACVLSIAFSFIDSDRAASYWGFIWLPSLVAGVVAMPILDVLKGRHEESIERLSYAVEPSGIKIIKLYRDDFPSVDRHTDWRYEWNGKRLVMWHGEYRSEGLGLSGYDGYQLKGDNVLSIKVGDGDSRSPVGHLSVPAIDYSAIEPFVRLDGGRESVSPKGAWLWPKQLGTVLYQYEDHIETALFIDWLAEEQAYYATQVELYNYSGRDIVRVKINGWDLLSLNPRLATECDYAEVRYIPVVIGKRIWLEWQYGDDQSWHSAVNDHLPSEPSFPAGAGGRSRKIKVLLGQYGEMSVSRQIAYIPKENLKTNQQKMVIDEGEALHADFKSKYIACMPNGAG